MQEIKSYMDPNKLLELMRQDRFNGNFKLTIDFLKEKLPLDKEVLKSNPLLWILSLIVNNDENQDFERVEATEKFKEKYVFNDKFQFMYSFYQIPHVILTHIMISSGFWSFSSFTDIKTFYHIHILGTIFGTYSFFQGDKINQTEYTFISNLLNEKTINDYLEKINNDEYRFKKYFCTPKMNSVYGQTGPQRLSQLFIKRFHTGYMSTLFSSVMNFRIDRKITDVEKILNIFRIFFDTIMNNPNIQYNNLKFDFSPEKLNDKLEKLNIKKQKIDEEKIITNNKDHTYHAITFIALMIGISIEIPEEYNLYSKNDQIKIF